MNKSNLLRLLAESGYNLGYGAKKHFATLDLIEKAPGWLGFFALVVGICALFIPPLATNEVSAVMIIFGVMSLYITSYDSKKEAYDKAGVHLTRVYNDMRTLYYEVKSLPENTNFTAYVERHKSLYESAFEHAVSKQIFLSDWYAHYKFFWQQQIEWIEEQKHFTLLRDKLPLTFSLTVLGSTVFSAAYWFANYVVPFIKICVK